MTAVSYKDIAKVVAAKLQDGAEASKIASELAQYLVAERRANDLDRIMREVERIRSEQENLLEVSAVSAFELSEETKKEISQLFGDKQVILNEEIDKDLVGGVRIQAGDTLLDLSVRGQLNRLRTHNF